MWVIGKNYGENHGHHTPQCDRCMLVASASLVAMESSRVPLLAVVYEWPTYVHPHGSDMWVALSPISCVNWSKTSLRRGWQKLQMKTRCTPRTGSQPYRYFTLSPARPNHSTPYHGGNTNTSPNLEQAMHLSCIYPWLRADHHYFHGDGSFVQTVRGQTVHIHHSGKK